ncbi:MAG: DUF6691 family protein [Betaproteobacteria bacterium]
MFPLAGSIDFSPAAEAAIAIGLGAGFGACLERAGFGSARRLTAVFYLRDMSVVKVMFTAIVTAMAGLWLASALGLIALPDINLETTNLRAQVAGGLLFGAGFIIGGYCPGTAVAAIATGSKDGLVFALGMLCGVLAYAELTPGLDAWYKATAQGEMTLPSVTGIGMGAWTLAFLAFLLFAAWGMRRIEARFADRRPAS